MDFQVPKITHEEVDENHGIFVIEPLDRGFGYTFGNSLRRVLLSSLEGAAVTSVKIEGVAHEFTTLTGVREDVMDIILNLKNLICRLEGDSPEIEVRLEKKGAGVVKASDIEAPADLEILNPTLEIANLADKGRLEVTLTIGRGRGYVPAELNRGPEHSIGTIPVDSIFSPVRRVAYAVEPARVGQRTDYDKLVLEIWTDGRITPEDALVQSSSILKKHFEPFYAYDENAVQFDETPQAQSQENQKMKKLLNMSVNEIELSVRAANCLNNANITSVGQLAQKTEAEMLKYRNFGKKSLNEIKEKLEALGLSLGMKFDERLLDTKKEA